MEAFYKSCYDFRWLLSRKDEPLGRAVGHIVLLALILAAARLSVYGPLSASVIDQGAVFVSKEMPELRIDHGVASVSGPQPWSRTFDKRFQVVLDASGKTQALDDTAPTGILVTRDKIFFKQGPGATQSFELASVKSFSSKGPEMAQMTAELKTWVYPVLVPALLGFSALGLALRWLLTGALAAAFAETLGSPLDWGGIVRIGAYALTPAAYFVLLGTLTPLRVLLVPTLANLFFMGVPLWFSKENLDDRPEQNGRREDSPSQEPPTDDEDGF